LVTAIVVAAPAAAQETTVLPPATTAPPETTAPPATTTPPTTAAPDTTAPATTGVPTTKRTTTTIPPTTTTPDQLPTLPTEATVPPAPGATTVETTDLTAVELDASVSPIFPALSIAGFITALLIVATQWFLTRRPGRATL
jgi:hypothetical protein